MVEKQVHLDAFELYYSMKNSRSYKKVADELGVGERAVSRWGKEFGWQERVKERDKKIAKRVEEKVIEQEVDTRVNFDKAINESIAIYRKMIKGKDSISEDTVKILGSLVGSYYKLEEIESINEGGSSSNNAPIFNLNFNKNKKPEDYAEEDGDAFEEETEES